MTTIDYGAAIKTADADIEALEQQLGDAALSGQDTTKVRASLRQATEHRVELEAEQGAAERAATAAERQAKRDDLTSLMVRGLRIDAEILRRREALVKAEAALARAQAAFDAPLASPLGDGKSPPNVLRRTVRNRLTRQALDDRKTVGEEIFALYAALPTVPGTMNDGAGMAPRDLAALAKEFDALADKIAADGQVAA